jgi:formate dehydrogenase subunit beta
MDKPYVEYRSTEKKPGHPVETIIVGLYKALLADGIVDGFVTFTEKKAGGGMQTVSVETSTDASNVNHALFSQYLVGGLPRLLSIPKVIHSQLAGCFDKRVAVVARPCDVRALVELSKRHQVSLNNLFIIGLECLGSVPVLDLLGAVKKRGEDPSKIQSCEMTPSDITVNSPGGESLSLKIGQDVKLRESCTRCTNREPILCDISLSSWGKDLTDDGAVLLRSETERGKSCLNKAEGMGLIAAAGSLAKAELEKRESIVGQIGNAAGEKLTKENTEFTRLDGEKRFGLFMKMIEPCTKCGLCIRACPVCWCKDCILLKKVKTIDPLLLHTTRLVHMGDTCVDCGKCDENCPKGIQVSKIFYGLATELGKITGYKPGLALEQPSVRSAKFILGKQ